MNQDTRELDQMIGIGLKQALSNCSVGKSPSGFPKIHVEMLPGDLIKMIGYDPRTIQPSPRRGQEDPHHVSEAIVDLIREVQRSLDQKKIEEMVKYLHNAVSSKQYADWSELDVVTVSKPDLSKWEEEHSVYFPVAAEHFITDGQHRYCALMDFVRRFPEYADNFSQAVSISVLPEDRLEEWSGQSFHDKNYLRTGVKMTKALAVDSRDLHNLLAKGLREHETVKDGGGVNEVKDALAATGKEFATHASLYRFTRGFCEGRRGLDRGPINAPRLDEESEGAFKSDLFEYVAELGDVFPHWTLVPGREEYLFRSSPALQALAVLGHDLYTKVESPDERRAMISRIGEAQLDWRRVNMSGWHGVIGERNENGEISPRSNRQAIDATIRFLREKSGFAEYISSTEDNKDNIEDSVGEEVRV